MKKTIKELDIYISDGNYSSKYPRSEEFVEEGIPFIRGNNMVDGDITDDEMYYITPEKHSLLLKGHVKAGDVLITTRGNIGQVAIVPDRHEDSNINAQIVLLRTNQETLYNRYLLWALQSHGANEQYLALQTGTALKQLPVGKLEKLFIEVTDINKQHEIADILDKTYEVVKLRRKELQLLDDLTKARFVEMFGDIILNDKGWKTDTWSNALKIVNGKNQKAVESDDGEYLICGSGGAMGRATEYLTNENSVIIGRKGSINKPLLMREKYWNVDTAFGIEPNRKYINVDYLYMFCVFFNFEQLNKAVTIPSLTKADLLNIEMPIPNILLQEQFADFVHQVDKSKVTVQKALDETKLLFDSLMQKYFG